MNKIYNPSNPVGARYIVPVPGTVSKSRALFPSFPSVTKKHRQNLTPKISITQFLCLSLLLFVPTRAQSGPIRIPLLTSATVQSDVILLANLLPQNVELVLRETAAKISLGTSPQIGSTRTLLRETIIAAITNAGLSQGSFLIPESIQIHRSSRILTHDEIFSAIQSALETNPLPQLSALRPEDLDLSPMIHVPSTETPLAVTKITYDEFIGRIRFRIQPKTVPATLPFYVTAHVPLSSTDRSAVNHSSMAAIKKASSTSLASSSVLVDPSHLTRLHIHSPDFDGVLQVRPLQRGHVGETIRVRLPSNGKTLHANVLADGTLDAAL